MHWFPARPSVSWVESHTTAEWGRERVGDGSSYPEAPAPLIVEIRLPSRPATIPEPCPDWGFAGHLASTLAELGACHLQVLRLE